MFPIEPQELVDVELVDLGPLQNTPLGQRLVDAIVDAWQVGDDRGAA
jgi:hypothetical protein